MEKEQIDIIIKKQFTELSEKDRIQLKDWCSNEDEFEQLKLVFKGIERLKTKEIETPRTETKKSLDDLFAQKHSKGASAVWYNSILIALYPVDKPLVQRPILQIAAIGLLMLLVYPFLFKNDIYVQEPQIAKVEKTEIKESTEDIQEETSPETELLNENTSVDQNNSNSPMLEDIPMKTELQEEISKEKSAEDFEEVAGAMNYSWTSAPAVSNHPDGIYVGAKEVKYSQSASDQPAILDLLTATF